MFTPTAVRPARALETGDSISALRRPAQSQPQAAKALRRTLRSGISLVLLAAAALLAGCQSPKTTFLMDDALGPDRTIALREGDVLKVTFPGAPNLNTTQQIRRDGNINLALAGDIRAAGRTPADLEKAILGVYGEQLLSKDVTVTLESTAFSVYVTGCVLRPGKVVSDRPITVLEAILEAGGFDETRANLKAVRVIRREGEGQKNIVLNLKPVIEGTVATHFYLRPSDIVYVPERFSLF